MASARVLNYMLHRRHAIVLSIPNTYKTCYHSLKSSSSGQSALYSTKKSVVNTDSRETGSKVQAGSRHVVKDKIETLGYLGVIVVGFGILCYITYGFLKERFSSKNADSVYSKAVDRCMKESKILDILGEPVKAYGGGNARSRRFHLRHSRFIKNDVEHMRMQFHLRGTRRSAVVHLEVKENESGVFEYEYLYVVIDDTMKMVITLEDNRNKYNAHNDELELNLS